MNYQEFQKDMKEQLISRLPEQNQVIVQQVVKNNDMQYDSLVILSNSANLSPHFYLQPYYKRYLAGETTGKLTAEIQGIYDQTLQEMGPFVPELSYSACRDKIIYRLISKEKNGKRLAHAPGIPFLDLMITFHVLMLDQEDGIGSVLIQDSLMEKWGLNTRQLLERAQENTVRLFPPEICSMKQMIQKMMDECGGMQDEWDVLSEEDNPIDPLVVTNRKGINGAAVMLYPGCLASLSERCGGDYYILPSSIHEVLVLPDQYDISVDKLEEMVRDVNHSCVKPDEILSEHVYHYSAQTGRAEVAVN